MPHAERKHMHGPLWTTEADLIVIQLWGPAHERDHWAIHWRKLDDDDEVIDSSFQKFPSWEEALAVVPSYAAKHIEAIRTLVEHYDPDEPCDHSQAHSWSIRPEGKVCGYCGRLTEDN